VGFMPLPLNARRRNPRYQMNMRFDGLHNLCGRNDGKKFLFQPEIEPRILGQPARNRETLLMSYTGFLMHS